MFMTCNKLTKPEMTAEQIAECQQCRHASGKKVWCCLFGIPIEEKSLIIQPNRSVIPARNGPLRYPSLLKQAGNFGKAAYHHIRTGRHHRTEAEQEACKLACLPCEHYDKLADRCRKCGCHLGVKISWASADCPLNRWPKPIEPPKVTSEDRNTVTDERVQ